MIRLSSSAKEFTAHFRYNTYLKFQGNFMCHRVTMGHLSIVVKNDNVINEEKFPQNNCLGARRYQYEP